MSKLHERIKHLIPQIVSDITNTTIDDRVKVSIRCGCGKVVTLGARNLASRWKDESEYRCKSCDVKTYINDPGRIEKAKKTLAVTIATTDFRQKASNGGKKLWHDPAYEAQRQHIKKCVSENNKTNPAKIESLKRAGEAFMADPNHQNHLDEIREKAHDTIRERCKTEPELRAKFAANLTEALKNPVVRVKRAKSSSVATTKRWIDPIERQKLIDSLNTPENKVKLASNAKKMWADPASIVNSQEYRDKLKQTSKANWTNPEFRQKISTSSKVQMIKQWKDPIFRDKMAFSRSQHPYVSSIQLALYKILNDLGVRFYREYPEGSDIQCVLGPWTFDCVVPRDGQKTLLIEVQGDYWHNLPDKIIRDKAKATYVARHQPNYELKCIWEHEFSDIDKIIQSVKSWLRIQ